MPRCRSCSPSASCTRLLVRVLVLALVLVVSSVAGVAAGADAARPDDDAAARAAVLAALRAEATADPVLEVAVVAFESPHADRDACPAEDAPVREDARTLARFFLPAGAGGAARLYAAIPVDEDVFFAAVEAVPGASFEVAADLRGLGGFRKTSIRQAHAAPGAVLRFGARASRSSDTCVVLEVRPLAPDGAAARRSSFAEEAAYVPADERAGDIVRRGRRLASPVVPARLDVARLVDPEGRPEWVRLIGAQPAPPLSMIESFLYTQATSRFAPVTVEGQAVRAYGWDSRAITVGTTTRRVEVVVPETTGMFLMHQH